MISKVKNSSIDLELQGLRNAYLEQNTRNFNFHITHLQTYTNARKSISEFQRIYKASKKPYADRNFYLMQLDYAIRQIKSKNPSAAECRKVLAREESKSHKPTISHYRDMKNGKRYNKTLSIQAYNNALKQYQEFPNATKSAEVFYYGNRLKYSTSKIERDLDNAINKYLTKNNENPKSKTVKAVNPNVFSTIIRDDKRKLERLQTQLKATPRNEKGKRENLRVAIAMIKESLKQYTSYNRNGKTAKSVNPKKLSKDDAIELAQREGINFNKDFFALGYSQQLFLHELAKQTGYKKGASASNSLARMFYQHLQKFNKKYNPKTKKANFTNADFHKFLDKTTRANSEMFQGKATGAKSKILAPSGISGKGFSRLGELKQMIVKLPNGRKHAIKFEKNAYLVMDLRRNLHAVGRGAKIENLKVVGNGLAKIGDLIQIDYVTDKAHIENGKTVYYYHKLGEVTKEFPELYIGKDKFPRIINGKYDVWDVGIVN